MYGRRCVSAPIRFSFINGALADRWKFISIVLIVQIGCGSAEPRESEILRILQFLIAFTIDSIG